jgi:hypothetical protein
MTKRKLAINKKAKREIDKFPLVEIKWLDITSDSSWQDIEDFLKGKTSIMYYQRTPIVAKLKGLQEYLATLP